MDAAFHPEWTTTHETANVMPIKSVGFLIEQNNDRVIKLAQSSNGDIHFSANNPYPLLL